MNSRISITSLQAGCSDLLMGRNIGMIAKYLWKILFIAKLDLEIIGF